MTAHSSFGWKMGDPITDDFIQEVANCVNCNRRGMRFTPVCYAIISATDGVVFAVCQLLDNWDRKLEFLEIVRSLVTQPDNIVLVEICEKVFPLIEIPKPKDLKSID